MGTLITCLNVELDEADPLKPAKGRTACASIRCVASCAPLGPARGRTAASVCCAASGVPEGGIRLSGGGMGSKYLRARFFKSMSCSRCTAAVLALFISLACPCSCFKVGTSARRNAREIHVRYMRNTCGIHAGYMYLKG